MHLHLLVSILEDFEMNLHGDVVFACVRRHRAPHGVLARDHDDSGNLPRQIETETRDETIISGNRTCSSLPWRHSSRRTSVLPPAMASVDAPVVVDGSLLEGGGQIVRVAAALSAATRCPVRVDSVRTGRSKPGLAAQHLAGLRLVGEACGGRLVTPDDEDVAVGSTAFILHPGSVTDTATARADERSSDQSDDKSKSSSIASYSSDVHTAGAISLVTQAILPVCAFSGRPTKITFTGGTDVSHAPPIGYVQNALAPVLKKHLDFEIKVEVKKRGYFPKGRGEVVLDFVPRSSSDGSSGTPDIYPPITIERLRANRGGNSEPAKLGCTIINGEQDGKRQQTESKFVAQAAFTSLLNKSPTVAIAAEEMAKAGIPVDVRTKVEPGIGDGGSVLMTASSIDKTITLASSKVFEFPKGVVAPNDRLKLMLECATRCGEELAATIESGAAVDHHLLDQLIVFMALADGRENKRSRVVAEAPISLHAQTAIAVCEQICGARFFVLEGEKGNVGEGLCAVECVGVGGRG